MNWKTIHGPGDDSLMPGTYVIEAHGVTFDPPVKMEELSVIIQNLGRQARAFIKDTVALNKRLRNAIPEDDPSMKKLITRILAEIIDAHRKETGETIFILRPNDGSLSGNGNNAEREKAAHRSLVMKYEANKNEIAKNDLNRAFILKACEERVLIEEKRVKVRSSIFLTPKTLWKHVKKTVAIDESFFPKLLPTLVSEGWVLFNRDEEVCVLPYGKGAPAYDAESAAQDHPAWSIVVDREWEV